MNSKKNNIISPEFNNIQANIKTESNYDLNQNRIITNRAKQLIKNFRKQHQIDTDNNNLNINNLNNNDQRILSTEINQLSSSQKKAKEELKSYDYYIRGEGQNNKPPSQNNNLVNEIPVQNIDIMNQENEKLKKQVMNLILENNNLKKKVNYNNNNITRTDYNNNIKRNDKIFLEESIDNMIKSNIRPWKNSNDNRMKINTNNSTNNKIIYQQRNPNYYNGINITSYDLNNNINLNNEKYSNIMNDYNQLLKEYRNIKFKYESLQHEYQNNKSIANKYRILNNNYNDLQNRTKELIIIVQKLKNDN